MEAESLNIKLRLDLSGVTAGVKKVKDQLTGMAKTVKDSIPHIKKEGDKAGKSLDDVSTASNKLKKSIQGIGKEAKSSLASVSAESSKVVSKLNALDIAKKSSSSFDTQDITNGASDASESVEKLQSTMQNVLSLNFAALFNDLFKPLEKVKKSWKDFKGEFTDVGGFTTAPKIIKETIADIFKYIKALSGKKVSGITIVNLEQWTRTKKLKSLLSEIKNQMSSLKRNLSELNKETIKLAKSVGSLVVKIFAAASALIAVAGARIANSTKEYREEQTKLNSAFAAAGASAKTAAQAYNGLFRFLGQSDRSVEAANHLAKLTTNQKELAEWTTICQGIYATFGDSLPIEGLTEAANETARTGKVTGVLADALNWAGVNEDAFNAALEKTTSLSQREALIRSTLNSLYNNAAQIYEQNNKQIIAQNEAQSRLNATMARIGQQTQVLVTSWINLKNTIMTVLAPAIIYISAVFSVLIDKLTAVIKWIGSLFGIKFDSINTSIAGVSSGISNIGGQTDGLTDSLDKANTAAQKLKRTTMGFDELNIVTNPNTSSGSSGTSVGGGIDVPSIEAGNSVIGQIGEKIDDVKAKVEAFFDKWKTQIAIIGSALGALSISKLLTHLGKAIGLGNKFLGVMSTIKKLAVSAITITLQYTLVNEFMDKYINGGGFKEYLKGLLVSAIGTGVLYAMWGPAGLVIGLGVTAVASIKSVIDNGGITNIESATVAFTGLASAIGAVVAAIKLLKGTGLFTSIASKLPQISGAIGGAAGAASGLGSALAALGGGSIVAGLGIVAAAIAAIVSVVVFLKRNWEDVTQAVKNFFAQNIQPKLDAIAQAWERMKNALVKAGEAILNALPPEVREWLQKVAEAIGNVINKIVEWVKSLDLLDLIGKAFEVLGGIITALVTGPIAGAITAVANFVAGFAEAISGVVEIVSGVVTAIVKLFSGDLKGAWEAVKQIGQGIVDVFKGMYDATIGVVVNFVKGIIDWFVKLWDELVGHSIVPDMINAIIAWFTSLPSKIFGAIDSFVKGIISKFKGLWDSIKSWFNTSVAKFFTKQYWSNKFDTIRQSASEKLNAAKNTIQNIWGNVSNWFKTNIAPKFTISFWADKFNSIKQGAKSALNGLITVVENAVNGIIRKINTLSWKIPDWVPWLGGETFGFNFREISIPRLAEGGITTRSTIANIGESGKEAILPLDQNTGWMDILADKVAARQQPQKVVLQVGEKELGWATIGAINGITRQTGQLQLSWV